MFKLLNYPHSYNYRHTNTNTNSHMIIIRNEKFLLLFKIHDLFAIRFHTSELLRKF